MNLSKFILVVATAVLVVAGFFRWQHVDEEPLIMTDGQGYYAYLPATFIYQDLSLQFVWEINEEYYPGKMAARYVNNTPNGPINKYFVGTAIMESPFFLVAHIYAKLFGHKADGYSSPYQVAIGVAGVFYGCIGLLFLFGFLTKQGFCEVTSALTGLMVLLATNLFFYSVYEPSMSHVYSFCTISATLFFGSSFVQTKKAGFLFGVSFLLGLTALIRPTNAIVLFALPLLTESWSQFFAELNRVFESKSQLIGIILVGAAVVAVQPVIYFFQTGQPFIWPYGEEGFNFLEPEIFNVLFSYRRGLFVYSPILLLAAIGLVFGLRKNQFKYAWTIVFLAFVTWVLSSWWMWYYGGSYGHRAFIEFIPLFSLGLASLIQNQPSKITRAFGLFVGFTLIGLQLFQTYQYRNQILPYDQITSKKYWNLFLRTGDDLKWYYTPELGDDSYTTIDSTLLVHDMESVLGWGNEHLLSEEKSFSKGKSSKMNATDQYGITLRYNVADCNHAINTIRVSSQISSNRQSTDLAYVCSIDDSTGAQKYWQSRLLRPQLPWFNTWGKATAVFTLPFSCSSSDRITVFPIKTDESTVFVDDLEISLIFVE